MSRIGQLNELKALRALAESSADTVLRQAALIDRLVDRVLAAEQRITALEAKRGPGRPPNNERNAPSSN